MDCFLVFGFFSLIFFRLSTPFRLALVSPSPPRSFEAEREIEQHLRSDQVFLGVGTSASFLPLISCSSDQPSSLLSPFPRVLREARIFFINDRSNESMAGSNFFSSSPFSPLLLLLTSFHPDFRLSPPLSSSGINSAGQDPESRSSQRNTLRVSVCLCFFLPIPPPPFDHLYASILPPPTL